MPPNRLPQSGTVRTVKMPKKVLANSAVVDDDETQGTGACFPCTILQFETFCH